MDTCLVDAYGTIIDEEFGVRWRELPAMAGVTADAWHQAYAKLDAELGVGHLSKAEAYDLVLRTCGVKPRDGLVRSLVARDRELLLSSAFLFRDAMPFLESLAARGITIVMVSNCGEFTRELLSELGVTAIADALVLSCEVGYAKPSPRIYRLALERVGAAAEDALFVDDQPMFCAGAEAVGITAVQIVRDESVPGRQGATVVRSLLEVDALV
jgi:putative hydrolase of the HAD superfamily